MALLTLLKAFELASLFLLALETPGAADDLPDLPNETSTGLSVAKADGPTVAGDDGNGVEGLDVGIDVIVVGLDVGGVAGLPIGEVDGEDVVGGSVIGEAVGDDVTVGLPVG